MIQQMVVDFLRGFRESGKEAARTLSTSLQRTIAKELWRVNSSADHIEDASFDDKGRVFVVSAAELAQYKEDGTRGWTLALSWRAHAIHVDAKGFAYVAGVDPETKNLVVARAGPVGEKLWEVRPKGISAARCEPHRISTDKSDNVFVLTTVGELSEDMLLLVALDSRGETMSAIQGASREKDGPFGVSDYRVYGSLGRFNDTVALDRFSNVYAMFRRLFDAPEFVLTKFDRQGKRLWQTPCEGFDFFGGPKGIVVDTAGAVYVMGKNEICGTRIVKLDPAGNQAWATDLEGKPARASTADAEGNLYVGWERWPNPDAAVLVKIKCDGSVLWQRDLEFNSQMEGTAFLVRMKGGPMGKLLVIVHPFFPDKGSLLAVYADDNSLAPTRQQLDIDKPGRKPTAKRKE